MADDKELVRSQIAEGFEFVRFVLKTPSALKKIRNGSNIVILPKTAGTSRPSKRLPAKTQVFTSETVFHAAP